MANLASSQSSKTLPLTLTTSAFQLSLQALAQAQSFHIERSFDSEKDADLKDIMPKQIFKNRVIAIAGKPPESITLQNLRTWIPLRKGRFAEVFDEEVTHLLCTHDEFKKLVPLVKQVLRHHKHVHVVHYDWLEFSAVQNKRLPEREYSMRAILSKQKAAQREKNRLESGRRLAERYINPNFFHVYQDREFFSYQIELTRDYCGDDEFVERYILTLWESNARPHLYWFTIKIMRRRGDPNAAYHRISPCSGKWRQEMNHFMEFFKKKTKIPWPQRVLLEGTTDRTVFQYAPPKGGKPVGRRLCLSYDHCIAENVRLRKPQEPKAAVSEAGEESSEEDARDATDATKNNVGDHGGEDSVMLLDDGFDNGQSFVAEHVETQDDSNTEPVLEDDCHISREATAKAGNESF